MDINRNFSTNQTAENPPKGLLAWLVVVERFVRYTLGGVAVSLVILTAIGIAQPQLAVMAFPAVTLRDLCQSSAGCGAINLERDDAAFGRTSKKLVVTVSKGAYAPDVMRRLRESMPPMSKAVLSFTKVEVR